MDRQPLAQPNTALVEEHSREDRTSHRRYRTIPLSWNNNADSEFSPRNQPRNSLYQGSAEQPANLECAHALVLHLNMKERICNNCCLLWGHSMNLRNNGCYTGPVRILFRVFVTSLPISCCSCTFYMDELINAVSLFEGQLVKKLTNLLSSSMVGYSLIPRPSQLRALIEMLHAVEVNSLYSASESCLPEVTRPLYTSGNACSILFDSLPDQKPFTTPDFEPAPSQFSLLLKATHWTGDVMPEMLYHRTRC